MEWKLSTVLKKKKKKMIGVKWILPAVTLFNFGVKPMTIEWRILLTSALREMVKKAFNASTL